jgi:homoaconitase/3-isopropylmalate dehydratase large subunit
VVDQRDRADKAQYKAMEFHGATIARMGIDGRMNLCHYSVKLGAKTALINAEVTMSHMRRRAKRGVFY